MINKIKALKKYTDCSMPSNEKDRIYKSEVAAYNQAIDDVVKLFATSDVIEQLSDLDGKTIPVRFTVTKGKPNIYIDNIQQNVL